MLYVLDTETVYSTYNDLRSSLKVIGSVVLRFFVRSLGLSVRYRKSRLDLFSEKTAE